MELSILLHNNHREEYSFQITEKEDITKVLTFVIEKNCESKIYGKELILDYNITKKILEGHDIPFLVYARCTYGGYLFPVSFIQEYLETLLELSKLPLSEVPTFEKIEILKKVWKITGDIDIRKLDELRLLDTKFYYLIIVGSEYEKYIKKYRSNLIVLGFNVKFKDTLDCSNFLNNLINHFEAGEDSEALKMIKNLGSSL